MEVIVVFSKIENAKNIRRVLMRSGIEARACSSGAQALQYLCESDSGIVVCGSRLLDMIYTQLYEYLPPQFEMLLVAPPEVCAERGLENIVCLSTPLRVQELLSTVNMMAATVVIRRQRKKGYGKKVRTEEETALIEEAKGILNQRNHLTEEEAHRYIQKRSMENGTNLTETAQMIISLMKG